MNYTSVEEWKWLFSLNFFDFINEVHNDKGLFFVAVVLLLLLAWCIYEVFFKRRQVVTHGSAAWGSLNDAEDAGLVTRPGDRPLLGKIGDKWLGAPVHSLVCAKTRGGKGVGVIIPTLLTYKGSIICNDVKGENYAVSARKREGMGQSVYVVDPYAEITADTHCFNPLDYIKLNDPGAVTTARQVAEILASNQKNSDGFFCEYGKTVLVTFILYVCAKFSGEERTLGQVRKMLTQSAENKRSAMEEMQKMEEFSGVIAGGANTLLELEGEAGEKNDTILGIYATAASMTAFLDDPRIAGSLAKSDFAPEMFRYEPCTLYIIVSPSNMAVSKMLLKMIYTVAVQQNVTAKKPLQAEEMELRKMERPLLFLMDEFAQLGHFEVVKDAMPVAAGYGVVFCIIIQGLNQLTEHYKEGGHEFLTNALKLFIGSEDTKTAEQISEMCGDTTVQTQSRDEKTKRITSSYTSRRLITVGEVIQSDVQKPFLLQGGVKPLRINRITYYKDKFFAGAFDKYSAG